MQMTATRTVGRYLVDRSKPRRSARLNSMTFELQGEVVGSELAEPFAVAGAMRPAGAAIRIHLATGDASVPGE